MPPDTLFSDPDQMAGWTSEPSTIHTFHARVGTVRVQPGAFSVGRVSKRTRGAMVTVQQDEDLTRRWAQEQAETERHADALVLRTLTALVTTSEELKGRIRSEIERTIDEYRRTRQQLDRELAQATAELALVRQAIERERTAVLAQAHLEARQIVDAARQAREAVLGEDTNPGGIGPRPTTAPHSTGPESPTPTHDSVASFTSPTSAPDRVVRPAPPLLRAYAPRPDPAPPHPVELIFEDVPGYQQASALERAVSDVLPDEEIDILQFDRGELVLGVRVSDLGWLADQLVAAWPASLELQVVAGHRARFRCV